MAGRNPKINIDQSTYHATKENLANRENATPIYESQEFNPPESLTKEERIIWDKLVQIIRETKGGYVSDADIMVMETYCKSKAEYDRACRKWNEDPRMYVQVSVGGNDKDGLPKTALKENQWYKIKRDFSLIMTKYLDQLGISPLGRAKQGLKSSKSKKDREKEELMQLFNREDD